MRWKSYRPILAFLIVVFIGLQSLSSFYSEKNALAAKEGVIVAFGDSLTAGLGVMAEKTYPALLAKKLEENGHVFHVVNSGVSGETSAGGLRRIAWILLKMEPDIVILELGANDGLRGLDLLEMKKNLSKMIEAFQKKGVVVILAGMKIPPNYGKDYSDRFEAVYPALANQYDLPLIPFFLEGVAAQPHLNQADGIHPTAAGYQVVVKTIWPIIQKVINEGFN